MSANAIVPRPAEQVGCSVVVVCDISGSMHGRKIERLRRELARLWPDVKGRARLIEFNDQCRWVPEGPDWIGAPMGGTYLFDALRLAETALPVEVIVISDGLPADGHQALDFAARMACQISVCFVGSDDDTEGVEFMRRLARVGGGVMVHKDLARNVSIEGTVREMLALPPPIAL